MSLRKVDLFLVQWRLVVLRNRVLCRHAWCCLYGVCKMADELCALWHNLWGRAAVEASITSGKLSAKLSAKSMPAVPQRMVQFVRGA